MSKDLYEERLAALTGETLDLYLRQASRLPGPRANLELAYAAQRVLPCDEGVRLAQIAESGNPTDEYLVVVGAMVLGRCLMNAEAADLSLLRTLANDARWRVREGVAMALQYVGGKEPARLMEIADAWAEGTLYERRAAAAALAEPPILKDNPQLSLYAVDLMDRVTCSIVGASNPKADDFVALRKALGYCWSVVVVAAPIPGTRVFAAWCSSDDKQVRWIVNENLKKDRLRRLDAEFVERCARLLAQG